MAALIPFVALYFLLAASARVLAVYAWSMRCYRSGRPLSLLMGAIAFWCGCRAMAAAEPSFEGTLFWSLLQFGGITLIMPAWLLLALSYAGHWWRRRLSFVALLFVPALFFFMAAISNGFHGLWYTNPQPDLSLGFMWLSSGRGPLFWAHTAYAYSCFVAGVVLLTRVARAANSAADAEGLLRAVTGAIAAAGIWERVAVGLLAPGGQQLTVDEGRLTTDDQRLTTGYRLSAIGYRLSAIGYRLPSTVYRLPSFVGGGARVTVPPILFCCRHLSLRSAEAAPGAPGVTRSAVAAAMRASGVVQT